MSRCARLLTDRLWQFVAGAAAQYASGAREVLDDAHRKSLDEHRLACALGTQNKHGQTRLHGRLGDGEGSVTGSHLAVERELAK